jgi:NAD(P)-dependent dehydrogenase (short-subunit alcohol dehydrogenase family)
MAEQDAIVEGKTRGMTPEEIWTERDAENPAGRVTRADEVAQMVAFLASPAASAVNAQAITVSMGSV